MPKKSRVFFFTDNPNEWLRLQIFYSQPPRERDAVRLDAEADEGGHRDAAVLDLGVAEPADRLRRRLADVERVPVADDRVELDGELLEAGGVLDLGRGPGLVREVGGDTLGRHAGNGRAHHHGRGSDDGREHICARAM